MILHSCVVISTSIYSRNARPLNHSHITCLCKLMRFKWQDKIDDTVLTCTSSIHTKVADEMGQTNTLPEQHTPLKTASLQLNIL